MKKENPNYQFPTAKELEDLAKLKSLIEKAVADGILSPGEMKMIKAFIMADGKVTVEELELCRELILSKIQSGELQYGWK